MKMNKHEYIIRQAFNIGLEDGSLYHYNTQRQIDAALDRALRALDESKRFKAALKKIALLDTPQSIPQRGVLGRIARDALGEEK